MSEKYSGLPQPTGPVRSFFKRLPIKRVVAGTVGALLLGYSGAAVYVTDQIYPMLSYRSRVDVTTTKEVGYGYRDVGFYTSDGVYISAWLFQSGKCQTPTNCKSAILVPGLVSNRSSEPMPKIAHHLLEEGFDVLMIDTRGEGDSGGAVTLGNKERYDVLAAYHFMKMQGYPAYGMLVLGVSAGGAATIEASPNMPDVGAIVTISAFAELRPELDRLREADKKAPKWIGFLKPLVFVYAYYRYGVDVNLRPDAVVASEPNRAFLFVQGGSDSLVPASNARQLRNASANHESELLVAPGLGHQLNGNLTPAEQDVIDQFIGQQIAEHARGATLD